MMEGSSSYESIWQSQIVAERKLRHQLDLKISNRLIDVQQIS